MSNTSPKVAVTSTQTFNSQRYSSYQTVPDVINASSETRPSLIDDTVYDMAWKAYSNIMLKNRLNPS